MISELSSEEPWQTVLRKRGHRLTPQRELVLAAVTHLEHGTPEEIHAEVVRQAPAVNLSTIYRNLALLDDLGLVRSVYLRDRVPTYHSIDEPAHVHLSCTACGAVTDADPSDFRGIRRTISRRHGFDIDLAKLVLAGTCASCRESSEAAARADVPESAD